MLALSLLLILAAPLSAFAELTVTTNKDIYTPDEKAIIVGAIPDDAPDGYAVLIKVTGANGDCATENTLPAADNSFRARPVSLEDCGYGEFTVSAFYAEQGASSRIIISNSSQADAGSRLELRTLQTVMLQALDVVNSAVRELIQGGYILPEEVASQYSQGVSEASLALEAFDFGDTAEAKKHMILAIQDFRGVLEGLDGENVAKFEPTASESNSDLVGTYSRLERTYNKLQNVAEKNGVDKGDEFEKAAQLLSDAREMISEENYEGAERRLEQVNAILEEIRDDLYEEEEKLTSDSNSTSPADEGDARRLYDTALKYQDDALELLNQTGTDADALAKVQEALSLIANATASIESNDLDLARDTLRAAHRAIIEAEKLIEDNEDEVGDASNEGEGSGNEDSGESSEGEASDNDNSGQGNGNGEGQGSNDSGSDEDKGNEGSGDSDNDESG